MNPEDIARELLRHRLDLTAYLRSLVCARDVAEDLFQDLCVKAIGRAAEFQNAEHVRRWFVAAGRNAAIDLTRRSRKSPVLLSNDALSALAADEEHLVSSDWHERLRALRDCLATLTPRAREIVRLRYGEGLSGGDVSRQVGRSLEAVYKSLARTYEHLRECIRRRETIQRHLS